MTAPLVPATPEAIARAADHLRAGELVAFPTETVYGLGADARNPDAVRRVFAAKARPADHPVIVHLYDTSQLADWARAVPDNALKLAAAFWPGPLTLILPRASRVADLVTGGQESVGLRVPSIRSRARCSVRSAAGSRRRRRTASAASRRRRRGTSPTISATRWR